MTLTASQALWFLPFVTPICLWAAWSDLKYMKIRNLSVAALIVVFLVIGLLAVPLADYPWRVLQIVVVLVAGFLANMLRLLGAGDAKFAAGMAAYVPLDDAALFMVLFATTLLGAFATHRMFRALPGFRARTPDWKSWTVKEFPMGLALGGSLFFYLLLGLVLGG